MSEESQRQDLRSALTDAGSYVGSEGAFHMKLPDKPQYPAYLFGLSPTSRGQVINSWRGKIAEKIVWTVWAYVDKGSNGKDAEGVAEEMLAAAENAIGNSLGSASVRYLGYVKPAIEIVAGRSIHRRGFEIETFEAVSVPINYLAVIGQPITILGEELAI